ncbi:glycosyl hydrolase [Phyllosticta capitalensis]|uniref:glycosyl hydrolase n=1 Tax=Phyllosticta capitalensis TaxID=121624 RepID=UPI00313262EE
MSGATDIPGLSSNGYSRASPAQASADAIPLLVDGTYHLFHLTTPPDTVHHPGRLRSSWSRLRSDDLRTWTRDAEPAITPGKNASGPDADGAWTGSAIIGPNNAMHIFYTGYNLSQSGRQVILHAVSSDKHGTHFTKSSSPITITSAPSHRAAFEAIDFRDPFVFFHAPTSLYWMLVATRLSTGPHWTRGCLALLTSPDLSSWALDPAPFYAPNDLLCPECPELFPLPNGKWYLVYSRFTAPDAGTVYRRDGKWLWGGDLCLPREVSANADGTLRKEPVREALDALMLDQNHVDSASTLPARFALSAVGSTATRFLDVPRTSTHSAYLLSFTIVSQPTASSFGVLLRNDASLRGHRLSFRPLSLPAPAPAQQYYSITLQTDLAPLDDFWADQYSLYVPRGVDGPELVRHDAVALDGDAVVRLLVQGDVVQCFVGGRGITFRLGRGAEDVDGVGAEKDGLADGEAVKQASDEHAVKELGFFVQDGDVVFDRLALRFAGMG